MKKRALIIFLILILLSFNVYAFSIKEFLQDFNDFFNEKIIGRNVARQNINENVNILNITQTNLVNNPKNNFVENVGPDPESYVLTVVKSGSGSGTVSTPISPTQQSGINCGTDCTESYDSGTSVTLIVIATSLSSIFSHWEGDCSNSNPNPICNLTMDENKIVTVVFSAIPDGYLSIATLKIEYLYGEQINLTNQSKIQNTGSSNIEGALLMKIQYYSNQDRWEDDEIIINDTQNNIIRNIPPNSYLALDNIWNSGNIYDIELGMIGYQRVYASLLDNEGEIINTINGSLENESYFCGLNEWINYPLTYPILFSQFDFNPYSGVAPFIVNFTIYVNDICAGFDKIKILFGDGNYEIIYPDVSQGNMDGYYTITHIYENGGTFYPIVQFESINGSVIGWSGAEQYNYIFVLDNNSLNFNQNQNDFFSVDNNYLYLENKIFFPIGLFLFGPQPIYLNEINDSGINAFWFINSWTGNSITYNNFFAQQNSKDIKFFYGSPESYLSILPLPLYSEQDIIPPLVFYQNYSHFIGWTNRDEPIGGYSIDTVEDAYNTIRIYDINRPIWMNFAPADETDNLTNYIQDVKNYSKFADIVSVDIYPVIDSCFGINPICSCYNGSPYCILDNPEISVVGDFVDLYKQQILEDENKPFWIILQGYIHDNIPPTYEQIRFMTYQSIIHGVNGIFYFTAGGGSMLVWNSSIKNVTSELSDLYDIILTNYDYKITNPVDGIEYLKINYNDTIYILAVNRNNQIVQKAFNTNCIEGRVNVLYENRQLNMNSNGIFFDTFQPFDTNIYEISCDIGCIDIFDDSTSKFRIQSSTGEELLAMDENGVMLIKGNLIENELNNPTWNNNFVVEDEQGNAKIWLDNNGNLHLKGSLQTFTESLGQTSNKELVIQDSNSENIALFDGNTGNLKLKSCLETNVQNINNILEGSPESTQQGFFETIWNFISDLF